MAGVLERRTAWLLAGPLAVDAGAGDQGLHAAELPVVADVIELILLGTVREECRVRALRGGTGRWAPDPDRADHHPGGGRRS